MPNGKKGAKGIIVNVDKLILAELLLKIRRL